MTVLEAKNLLFIYFSNHTELELEKNFSDLVKISLDPDLDKGILEAALEDLQKIDLVRTIAIVKSPSDKARLIWVLVQPLDNYVQTVSLNRQTASVMVALLNSAAEQYKRSELFADPLNLQEKDIQNLLILLQGYIHANDETTKK